VELAADEPQRLDHYLRAGLRRDWATTFEPVLDQLDSWFTG
jgi:hypothetical protein